MHEAIGDDIAESSCFLMVTLQFRRVNSTIVWRCSCPYNKLEGEGAGKRGELKKGTILTGSGQVISCLQSRTGGPS